MTYCSSQLKIFTLLCSFTLASHLFCAAPAHQSFDDRLAAIDAMSHMDILCRVRPIAQKDAQAWLDQDKRTLKQDAQKVEPFAQAEAQYSRAAHKWLAIHREIDACHDAAHKAILQQKLAYTKIQYDAAQAKFLKEAQALTSRNMIINAFNYRTCQAGIFQHHASILLAQKEKLENQKIQLQQREQALLAQLNSYQLLVDGPQIEGMPHAPGGLSYYAKALKDKPEKKRRGSF